ncbi:unnamed protein product [Arctia plantaginis]|uniref:Uncharacterized protein n=1 Tax=Arctia plantaginis TaxID=874455 RepID=A0A8S1ARP7_ARCPL|nr:unnamed protein product [Arctia plantaginis]
MRGGVVRGRRASGGGYKQTVNVNEARRACERAARAHRAACARQPPSRRDRWHFRHHATLDMSNYLYEHKPQ